MAGHDARDFRIAKGDHVTVPARSTLSLSVEFVSRFLRPAAAILVLVGRRQGSAVGTTLTFNLRTQIDNIVPKVGHIHIVQSISTKQDNRAVSHNTLGLICHQYHGS